MKLSKEARNTVADCISKGIHLTLDVQCDGEPMGGWCDKCEKPSMVEVQLRGISGVFPVNESGLF
ncbi:hypothetical protein [Mycobacteroides abscessus]|uniref:hypothetical protein n=1 Tax=Mycobacteroides abscessus TaxID=36809 RepID=UPI00092B1934|nr:hypothetical protein [Mycobacteroides abscessus]SIK28911.1 Uncharacterised protein [Mycobacteroides abscessus subsp. abscessus]SLF30812.1 Uncharacterised protein [Mycobacteroides abscessus subsp. abscessus]